MSVFRSHDTCCMCSWADHRKTHHKITHFNIQIYETNFCIFFKINKIEWSNSYILRYLCFFYFSPFRTIVRFMAMDGSKYVPIAWEVFLVNEYLKAGWEWGSGLEFISFSSLYGSCHRVLKVFHQSQEVEEPWGFQVFLFALKIDTFSCCSEDGEACNYIPPCKKIKHVCKIIGFYAQSLFREFQTA